MTEPIRLKMSILRLRTQNGVAECASQRHCNGLKAQFPEIRGSGFTVTSCVSVWPSTVSRTVY
jgi:hypothetical protein